MADQTIYAHTYWSHKGKYPKILAEIQKLVPASGEIPGWSATHNKELETFRIAQNCYYDLYNNGLCNRLKEFRKVFGSCGYKRGDELTEEIVNNVETRMDELILRAAKEQGIALPEGVELCDAAAAGLLRDPAFDEMIAEQEKDVLAQASKDAADIEKPFVQLSGQDGNVFSIIGRVSGALKKANQSDKAHEFTEKAFAAGSYDEVLRLAMEYCDVA